MSGKRGNIRGQVATVLTHLFLTVFTLVVLTPLIWVLKLAFSGSRQGLSNLSFLPSEPTFDNFMRVVGNTSQGKWVFGHHLLNSVIVSLSTTVLGIILATSAAYAFSRFRFAGRKTGLMSFLVSQMFPGVLMLIPLYVIMQNLGLLNSLTGLIVVYSTTAIPFCVWMLKGYFDTIPKELEESALVDGASRFTIFWKIILPLSAPAISVTALFSFMTAWNEFLLAYTFMTDPLSFTLPVQIQQYFGEQKVEWELFAASSVIVSIPVMVLFYALQKHLAGGLTAGSVKG